MIAGVVIFITLELLGVPYPALWATWVGLVDFLPEVGGALAGIPTVCFTLTHSLFAGVVTAAVFLGYTMIENHLLNPVVMSRTVKINPLLVFTAVLVGADFGGIIGGPFSGFVAALLAIPIAAALQIVVRDLWLRGHTDRSGAGSLRGNGPPGSAGSSSSDGSSSDAGVPIASAVVVVNTPAADAAATPDEGLPPGAAVRP